MKSTPLVRLHRTKAIEVLRNVPPSSFGKREHIRAKVQTDSDRRRYTRHLDIETRGRRSVYRSLKNGAASTQRLRTYAARSIYTVACTN
jgi:hypothetical protein